MTTHHTSPPLGRRHPGAIPQAHIRAGLLEGQRARTRTSRPRFVSDAHARFARALGQNGIVWRYKPRTFAIEWDAEGNLLDSITPDFYLPDHRQYIELASEPQSCVAAIARRLRLLSHAHPEIDVHLIVGPNYLSEIKRFLPGVWTAY